MDSIKENNSTIIFNDSVLESNEEDYLKENESSAINYKPAQDINEVECKKNYS